MEATTVVANGSAATIKEAVFMKSKDIPLLLQKKKVLEKQAIQFKQEQEIKENEKRELEQMQSDLKLEKTRLKDFYDEIKKKEGEIINRKSTLENELQFFEKVVSNLDKLKTSKDELLRKKQGDLDLEKKELNDLEKKKIGFEEKNKEVSSQIEELIQKIKTNEKKEIELNAAMREYERLNKKLNEDIAENTSLIQEKTNQIASLHEKSEKLASGLDSKKMHVSDEIKNRENIVKKLSLQEIEIQKLEKKKEDEEGRLNEMKLELEMEKNKLNNLEFDIKVMFLYFFSRP